MQFSDRGTASISMNCLYFANTGWYTKGNFMIQGTSLKTKTATKFPVQIYIK